jgi:hypothetical protein
MADDMVHYTMPPALLRFAGPAILVTINGRAGAALLDTGASASVIDLTFAQRLNLPTSGTHQTAGVTGAGQYPKFNATLNIPILGVALPSPIGGLPLRELGHPWDAIVGRDILCQYELTIDGKTGLIRFS